MAEFTQYSQVMLAVDVPKYHLQQSDLGTIVDILEVVDSEQGYVVEFFDVKGKTVGVHILSASQLYPLPGRTIAQARAFEPA